MGAQAGIGLRLVRGTISAAPVGAQLVDPILDQDYRDNGQPDEELVELGRRLFFDKVLSGNRNISCATCHHPLFGTGDAISMSVGEGGRGIGDERDTGKGASRIRARVPRNAPALFNIGARQFRSMFHDGRVQESVTGSGFDTPAGADLPDRLADVVAAQALFPLTNGTEMAGQADENEIGAAVAAGQTAGRRGAWDLIAARVRGVPEYVRLFRRASDTVGKKRHITIVEIANAIAAFESAAWRSDNSPFDDFLRGDDGALTGQHRRGMNLFYGRARCSSCHDGAFQTDQKFHSIALPQDGPGNGDGVGGHEDFGRQNVSGGAADRFAYRTPSLRNVTETGPWGHSGAFATLEGIVRHYIDPPRFLRNYDRSQAILPSSKSLDPLDFLVMNDRALVDAIGRSNGSRPVRLNDADIADLIAFLEALTDPDARDLSGDIPSEVPSGLGTQ